MSKRLPARACHALTLCVLGAIGGLITTATPALATSNTACRAVTIPVALAAGEPDRQVLAGSICGVQANASDQILQILVPGLTYTRAYWDFPYDPDRYSYVRYANQAGYATLDIDRLGTGASSHPPAHRVTQAALVYTLHEVIQAARASRFGGPFRRVILVGHSEGSLIALVEVASYHNVDGFIQTGLLSTPGPLLPLVFALEPAQLDPVTAEQHDPLGYLTTYPGLRQTLFYAPGTTDPQVVAQDERLKSTATAEEVATAIPPYAQQVLGGVVRYSDYTRRVTVPVMLAVGSDDRLFCEIQDPCTSAAVVDSNEAGNYTPAAHLSVFLLPGAGHDISLATDARSFYAAAANWIQETFSARSGTT
jgi:pimeloyl-ACP methyl ester carboxylesterase